MVYKALRSQQVSLPIPGRGPVTLAIKTLASPQTALHKSDERCRLWLPISCDHPRHRVSRIEGIGDLVPHSCLRGNP